jgi:hypothetical protein
LFATGFNDCVNGSPPECRLLNCSNKSE